MSYPATWTKVKFGEIAKRKSVRIDNPKESEYEKYVGLEHLDSGELVVKRWGSTKDVSSNMQIFNKNDILFARRNTYLKRISVALFDGICSGDIIVIEPILNHIVERFLPIYMQFKEFEDKVVAWSAGAFSKRIKWKQLSDFEIWIPSKEEQQKIVDIIWSVHDNQERIENLIQVAEKLKGGLLEELLTKGIGHNKFKKTELGEIPEEWKVHRLSEIIDIIGGGTPKTSEKIYWNGDIPWISAEDISKEERYILNTVRNISQKGLENSSTKVLEAQSIIISARGTVGLIGQLIKPMAFNQSCYGLLAKDNVDPNYLYYLLKFKIDELKQDAYGGVFNTITIKNFNYVKISLPSIKEQKLIVKMLDSIYEFIQNNRIATNKIILIKKKLANSFLSGELLIPKEVIT